MADIDLQRKERSGGGWLWGILALLALIAIVWGLSEWGDEDEMAVIDAEPELVVTQPMPQPATAGAAIPVGDILANPASWAGRTVSGQVRVSGVPTDRGFWIEDGGQRIFAVIIDEPREEPKDINEGQSLSLDNATVRTADAIGDVPGVPLDRDTESIIQDQGVFLLVDESDIDIGS